MPLRRRTLRRYISRNISFSSSSHSLSAGFRAARIESDFLLYGIKFGSLIRNSSEAVASLGEGWVRRRFLQRRQRHSPDIFETWPRSPPWKLVRRKFPTRAKTISVARFQCSKAPTGVTLHVNNRFSPVRPPTFSGALERN